MKEELKKQLEVEATRLYPIPKDAQVNDPELFREGILHYKI